MARTRTSVELHPDGCRLVEVDLIAAGKTAGARDARVRTFVASVGSPEDPVALAGALGRLRRERRLSKDVAVTLWGLRSVHQLLRLPPAGPDALEAIARREARKEIAALEAGGGHSSVTVEPGPEIQVGAHRKREVALVAASVAEIQQRIQPLIDAGFTVQRVLTPAMALTTLARTQRDTGGTVAYVAMTGRAICFAVVRNRMLMFARELPWGHEPGFDQRGQPAEEFSSRLASELKRSILYFKQTFRAPVEGVALCGDMPNLRALTSTLGDALALPIQVLDSLVGIDAAAVPEPAEAFRREVAALRLAIAAGADATAGANLLPKSIVETRATRQQIARWAVSVAAGLFLTIGWFAVARSTVASQRSERDAIRRELAIAEPGAARQSALQREHTMAISRQAALSAFESQGPRLARLLEAVAAATPDEVVLTQMTAQADREAWRVDLRGTAISSDAAVAQAAVSALVERLSESPYGGAPLQPPSRRLLSARATTPAGGAQRAVAIPAGMTGVEFGMQIRVAK